MIIDINGFSRKMTEEEVRDYNAVFIPSPSDQILQLKAQLAESDYKTLKYFEGWLSPEEYVPVKEERQRLRDEINRLEAVINGNRT